MASTLTSNLGDPELDALKSKRCYLVLMDVLLENVYYFRLKKRHVTVGFTSGCDIIIPERDKLGIDLTRAPLVWWRDPVLTLSYEAGDGAWTASTGAGCRLRSIVFKPDLSPSYVEYMEGEPLENPSCFHFSFTAPFKRRVWPAWERLRFWYIEMTEDEYQAMVLQRKREEEAVKMGLEGGSGAVKRPKLDRPFKLYDLPAEILGKIAGHLPKDTMLDTLAMVSPLLLPKLVGQVRWPELVCDDSLDSVRIGDLSAVGAVRAIKFCQNFQHKRKLSDLVFDYWMERLPKFLGAKITPQVSVIAETPAAPDPPPTYPEDDEDAVPFLFMEHLPPRPADPEHPRLAALTAMESQIFSRALDDAGNLMPPSPPPPPRPRPRPPPEPQEVEQFPEEIVFVFDDDEGGDV